ncbi:MAG TPA: hypothetical protein VLH84_02925 [Patescibacteria group bacterium]|nr:hypothetical protein [Patescibacteria group bacterium]
MILLTLLVCTTQPHSLPQVVLIAPFILLFVSLALFVAVLLALKSKGLTVRHLRLGALAASLPILLLILQSIGQLTLRDVATTGALFVLGYFYMARRAVGQRSER